MWQILIHLLIIFVLDDKSDRIYQHNYDQIPSEWCAARYSVFDWTHLNETQQKELYECVSRREWFQANEESANSALSVTTKCDLFMSRDNIKGDWSRLGAEARFVIGDCIKNRVVIQMVRQSGEFKWVPHDLLDNPYRAFTFVLGLVRAVLVNLQQYKDSHVEFDVLSSATYQSTWLSLGLNGTHYAALSTPEQLAAFRESSNLEDYAQWNSISIDEATGGLWILGNALKFLNGRSAVSYFRDKYRKVPSNLKDAVLS